MYVGMSVLCVFVCVRQIFVALMFLVLCPHHAPGHIGLPSIRL